MLTQVDQCFVSSSFQVEKELSDICSSILSLLDDHLIPTASSGESKVFYLKVRCCFRAAAAFVDTSWSSGSRIVHRSALAVRCLPAVPLTVACRLALRLCTALQMKGDYHRYLAEFKTSSDRKDAAEHTLLAYKAAQVCQVAIQRLGTSYGVRHLDGIHHLDGICFCNGTARAPQQDAQHDLAVPCSAYHQHCNCAELVGHL